MNLSENYQFSEYCRLFWLNCYSIRYLYIIIKTYLSIIIKTLSFFFVLNQSKYVWIQQKKWICIISWVLNPIKIKRRKCYLNNGFLKHMLQDSSKFVSMDIWSLEEWTKKRSSAKGSLKILSSKMCPWSKSWSTFGWAFVNFVKGIRDHIWRR